MGKHTSIKLALFWASLISLLIPQHAALAQLDEERMAAVSSIVHLLLLSTRDAPISTPDGQGIGIDLNELIDDSFQVSSNNQFFVEFELQPGEVEFCFDLSSNGNIDANDVAVTFNETSLSAVAGKDNCYQFTNSSQRDTNFLIISVQDPNLTVTVSQLELASTNQQFRRLNRLTRGEWDERAVRKVLKIFAFGGHALDSQIRDWADMDAVDAIEEMLNFDKHNFKLSPLLASDNYRATEQVAANEDNDIGLLTNWLDFISNASSDIPIPLDRREQFGVDGFRFQDGFSRMVTVRGLNPFRQRIGIWETNYHLAVNRAAGVNRRQIVRYYDTIMQAHEDNLPYYQVMGEAAKSAAIAVQYGHRFNEWNENTGECLCNDDFAREIHQLFYGIFGINDPDHEEITIPETAKMLTDMRLVNDDNSPDDDVEVNFETDDHHIAPVNIFFGQPFFQAISGADAAAKIDNLMPISMQHPESLSTLPVMIISVLADDNLSEAKRQQLRSSWASLGVNRRLLDFIHAYAVSDLFHSNSQRKYFTSHERALYLANKNNLENIEAYFDGNSYNNRRLGRAVGDVIDDDLAGDFFRPINNVFGGQTGEAAAGSALIFENNYNSLTDDEFRMREAVECEDCALLANGNLDPWEKKWSAVLPRRSNGNFYVADVAEWLWNHAIGSLDDFTDLERAHLYTLLATGQMDPINDGSSGNDSSTISLQGARALDFNLMMCVIEDHRRNPNRFTNQNFDPSPSANILEILQTRRWDDYCRDNDGGFEQFELDILNKAYTRSEIENDPEIQQVLDLLGNFQLVIEGGPSLSATNLSPEQELQRNLRLNTLQRINAALGFIYTTPFVFAEGQ